jgi:hypothetical protein
MSEMQTVTSRILRTPLSDTDIADLRIGDMVYLSGIVVTGRDDVHRRVVHEGIESPVDLRNGVIYHAGPIVRENKPVHELVSVGPTSSIRMEAWAAEFIAKNIETRGRKKKAVVFGSGPIRIGQGIEFDYCSVHCVWALKNMGWEAVICNNNPETVSTDFDTGDRLYFDPLTIEDVESLLETEKPDGVVVQFGGQTAIKLTKKLDAMGVRILGTSADSIDEAEDRERFDELLERKGRIKAFYKAYNIRY